MAPNQNACEDYKCFFYLRNITVELNMLCIVGILPDLYLIIYLTIFKSEGKVTVPSLASK